MARTAGTGRIAATILVVALAATTAVFAVGPSAPAAADGNEASGAPFAARSLTAGFAHTCALVHEGSVKCWGNGASGKLGYGDQTSRGSGSGQMADDLPAVALGTDRAATAITAGNQHTCAVLDNGTVKCWGSGGDGRLGYGDATNRGDAPNEMGNNLPAVALGTGRTATAITAGTLHTCALLDNATVKCWGSGTFGQLGYGDTTTRGDGPNEMGNNLPTVALGTGRTATAITAGAGHTCALLDNNAVKCWGLGGNGRLGYGDTTIRGDGPTEMGDSLPAVALGTGRTATAITAGGAHTCALLDNNAVKCWGFGGNGRLGYGDTNDRGDTAGEMGDILPAVALGTGRTATAITTGEVQTCARLDNSAVKCWGAGGNGHLGYGDIADRGGAPGQMGDNLPAVALGTGRTATAITIGTFHTCARLDDDSVKCWGSGNSGQLGYGDGNHRGDDPNEMGDDLPAVDLGSAVRTVSAVWAGGSHNCVVLDNGNVKCWGSGAIGQLGYGDTTTRGTAIGGMGDGLPRVDLGTGRTATAVNASDFHTCAVLDNGAVKCWGNNISGQLGYGDTNNRGDGPGEMGDNLPTVDLGTGRTATAVIADGGYTCAILDNGTIKCWGLGNNGRLGYGDVVTRGDGPGEMGDNLPTVDLGTGRTATAITAANGHTCAMLDNGMVKCWGAGGFGQLGYGDVVTRGDGPGEMGDNLPTVDLGTGRTATAITTGSAHTCAILDNGTIKCWGLGSNGRLGYGDVADRGAGPDEMGDNLPAIDLGTGRTATSVTAAVNHTCARLDNGTVKCWGSGNTGKLGYGDTNNRGDGPGEMGDSLPGVDLVAGVRASTVSAGSSHTCARLTDGTLRCWGQGSNGQLGLRDTATRGDGSNEMGANLPAVDLGIGEPTGMTGTVVDTVNADPVPGAHIALLDTTDFALLAGTVADNNGDYEVTVAPGDYFAYLIDPANEHTAGFSTPFLVTVPPDTIADTDLTMAPTRGAIAGTVIDETIATPIPGALVFSLTNGGVAETATIADNNGDYTLGGLRTGNHYVAFADQTGNHRSEFWPDSLNVPDATTLAVTAGGTTTADSELPTQTGTLTGANLTGTIVQTGTLTPLENIVVLALHASDFRLARATTTNGAGQYTLDVQASVGYKLAFYDANGLHGFEWHNNQPNTGLGTATTVVAPTVTNNTMNLLVGTQTGTITDQTSGDPLDGAWVFAIGATGLAGGTTTAPDGTYTITGLPPGTYRTTIVDPNGGRGQLYHTNSPTFDGATPYNITAGATTPNINAALAFN